MMAQLGKYLSMTYLSLGSPLSKFCQVLHFSYGNLRHCHLFFYSVLFSGVKEWIELHIEASLPSFAVTLRADSCHCQKK